MSADDAGGFAKLVRCKVKEGWIWEGGERQGVDGVVVCHKK